MVLGYRCGVSKECDAVRDMRNAGCTVLLE